MRTRIGVCAAILALVVVQAEAKMARFELRDMVEEAEVIVVGTVDSVGPVKGEPLEAHIKITEVLKGNPGEYIDVSVDKTWACDISEAKKGEPILLFTEKDSHTGRSRIYASGRGRMPIDTVKGTDYATYWPEVRMPGSIKTTDGPEPKSNFIRRANLRDLKAYIKEVLKEPSGKNAEKESR